MENERNIINIISELAEKADQERIKKQPKIKRPVVRDITTFFSGAIFGTFTLSSAILIVILAQQNTYLVNTRARAPAQHAIIHTKNVGYDLYEPLPNIKEPAPHQSSTWKKWRESSEPLKL